MVTKKFDYFMIATSLLTNTNKMVNRMANLNGNAFILDAVKASDNDIIKFKSECLKQLDLTLIEGVNFPWQK